MPDMDLFRKSFYSTAYQIILPNGSNKIRDIKSLEYNNYNVTKLIYDLKRTLKNTTNYEEEIKDYIDQILYFYRGSIAIEYMLSWKSLFELLILCSENKKANNFYSNILFYANNLDKSILNNIEYREEKTEEIVNKLKKSIIEYLKIALAMAAGLDYSCLNDESSDIRSDAEKFRMSNLINHQMVSFPLINYTNAPIMKCDSLLTKEYDQNLIYNSNWEKEYALCDFKIKWSPRFIHLNELYLWFFLCYFYNRKNRILHTDIYQQFLEDNNLSFSFKNPVTEIDSLTFSFDNFDIKKEPSNTVRLDVIQIDNDNNNIVKIAIVNTKLTKDDALISLDNITKNLTFSRKKNLYKILNSAVEENAKYIVFPEFFLPYLWIDDLMKFAKQNNLTIISGLQYIICNDKALNMNIIVSGTMNKSKFKNSILIYREKNYYAPNEKVLLAQRGYKCMDAKSPYYCILKDNIVALCTMLCFEFTDINSRTVLKSRINFLFVPQMNRDTHYFSSIVESTARDLYTFVIQSNTSIYGDSRITAPSKTDYRELLQIKGGINDIVLIEEIDIEEFEENKKIYPDKLDKAIKKCLSCKHRKCDNCKVKIKYHHKKYKGLPPRYKNS